ncbi:hypothetical protein B0A48_13642 [Cryoendolithus antarcticus]|uniref:Dynactin subunit 4 n=1 Tax=Cryoendolithus antarcticus TaxID=1507870 RepID=A0A1V8SP76_9PEZI|nr:hypothetical protein B0A48_13642 [Cryoendolithus antarcticus]
MDLALPSAHYACPCSSSPSAITSARRASHISAPLKDDDPEQSTFDPHSPRSAYNLLPLTHLLFCDECSQIRCPKCTIEEVITWYCPSCLFEVPSGSVRGDGNRCARSCLDCPVCEAPLNPTSIGERDTAEEYVLRCGYCHWTSADAGIKLAKSTKLTEQLAKFRRTRVEGASGLQHDDEANVPRVAITEASKPQPRDHDDAFGKLTTFYKEQLSESSDAPNPYGGSNYNSPTNLARIMGIYGGLSRSALKKSREKPQPMREAHGVNEGVATFQPEEDGDERDIVGKMRELGWDDLTSEQQQVVAPVNGDARFTSELWPVSTRLRTKRGKRCKVCNQIVFRPEAKPGSTRTKVRMLAHDHIPKLALQPLNVAARAQDPSFIVRKDQLYVEPNLRPHAAQQYVLTVTNPLFETVKVTLTTPAITPGKVKSRVTILCPEFSIGPAGEMWDDALSSSTASTSRPEDGSRKAAMASLTGGEDSERQPEAGKVWEKSRNRTKVILEIVPGALKEISIVPKAEEAQASEVLGEDEDVLQVPIFVRAEWMAEVSHPPGGKPEPKELREIGYWCVLGVGRIMG